MMLVAVSRRPASAGLRSSPATAAAAAATLLFFLAAAATAAHPDASHRRPKQGRQLQAPSSTGVIIGGAGWSGISFARELNKKDVNDFFIAEATNRVGGRTWANRDFGQGADGKKYPQEYGSQWINGGRRNPVRRKSKLLPKKFRGVAQFYYSSFFDEDRKKIMGNYGDDWESADLGANHSIGTQMDAAYIEGMDLAETCLMLEPGQQINESHQEYCNKLCLPLIEGDTFRELRIGTRTVCQPDGIFRPGPDIDMSYQDLLRAATGWYPPNDPTCVTKTAQFYYLGSDQGEEIWRISARRVYEYYRSWKHFKDADLFVADKRGYQYILHYWASRFLSTSKLGTHEILFDDERLSLQTRVLEVSWDPDGIEDVSVTMCNTFRVEDERLSGLYHYPCIGDNFVVTAREFVSSFSYGVLKHAVEAELQGAPPTPSVPRFDPPLSSVPGLADALTHNKMGQLGKFHLQFEFRFWNDKKEYFSTPFSSEEDGPQQCATAPLWTNYDRQKYYKGSNILLGFNTAETTANFQNKTDDEIIDIVLPVFNKYWARGIRKGLKKLGYDRTKLIREDVIDFQMNRWSQDSLFRGCWANPNVGNTIEQHYAAARRYGNLVFTGEHTCRTHYGYTHGALLGGKRAARELLHMRYGMEKLNVPSVCDVSSFEAGENLKGANPGT